MADPNDGLARAQEQYDNQSPDDPEDMSATEARERLDDMKANDWRRE